MKILKKSLLKWTTSIIFTLFFIYLLSKVNFVNVLSFFLKLPGRIFFLFICLMFISFLAKTYRIYVLNKNITFLNLLNVSITHNFFLTILPFRLGEITYVTQLKKQKVKVVKSVSDLVVMRLLDFIILGLFFLTSIFLFSNLASQKTIILAVLFLIMCSWIFFFPSHIWKTIPKFKIKNKIALKIIRYILRIHVHLVRLSWRKRITLLVFSLIIWVASCTPYIILLHSLTNLTISQATIATLITLISTTLPLNAPGGMGIVEAGWLIGLAIFKIFGTEAINLALFLHAMQILSLTLIFVTSRIFFLILNYLRKNVNRR